MRFLAPGWLALLSAPTLVFAQSAIEMQRRDEACPPDRRAEASAAIQDMFEADQAERTGTPPPGGPKDKERRLEVARLFAEGCMGTAADFYNAAMIFQHGQAPEHYLQTLIWATRAKDMGHAEADYLITRAADRYLMSLGRKQLYGTNLVRSAFVDPAAEEDVWCLWPLEDSFPQERRDAEIASGRVPSMELQTQRVAEMNNGALPGTGPICAVEALPSPAGSVPGHW